MQMVVRFFIGHSIVYSSPLYEQHDEDALVIAMEVISASMLKIKQQEALIIRLQTLLRCTEQGDQEWRMLQAEYRVDSAQALKERITHYQTKLWESEVQNAMLQVKLDYLGDLLHSESEKDETESAISDSTSQTFL